MYSLRYLIINLITLIALNKQSSASELNKCPDGYLLSRDPSNIENIRCIKTPQTLTDIILAYPFQAHIETICSQGNQNITGSHSHDNILFALDFYTPYDKPASIVAASHSGIAYVYNECNFRKNDGKLFNLNDCGSGYGNHVRILDKRGFLTIYAHLSEIFIKNIQEVNVGDKIGIEGLSGNAGQRHLHFGVHIPTEITKIANIPGYTGISIPFNIRLKIDGKITVINSTNLDCHSNSQKIIQGANTHF